MLSTTSIKKLLSSRPKDCTTISSDQDKESLAALQTFYQNIPEGEKVLVVVGGGTAALTYLYTQDIPAEYTHIVILGDRGYWETAAHRLAQPQHILALPYTPSDEFVDPAKHDEEGGIFPHESRSAYTHSHDFQERLGQFEEKTLESLSAQGKKVFIARHAKVNKIERIETSLFGLAIQEAGMPIFANQVIVASGAGPARKLPPDMQTSLASSLASDATKAPLKTDEKILSYSDILSPVAEKCRDKDVLVYGGGATAAWAMEVATLTAKPVAWVAKSGFELAISAGPRVNAIIKRTRQVQIHGSIDAVAYDAPSATGEQKILVKVSSLTPGGSVETNYFHVDYLINCIGQEPYEPGGLPEIISSSLKSELTPYLDKNFVTGTEQPCMLGWASPKGDFMIIGAAQGTYYDRERPMPRKSSVSEYLPISGQVPITIGGVVSSVCALTNYMPITQNPKTGEITVKSLNLHVMNATQLATYFTASFPEAKAAEVNKAVADFIAERTRTDFGLAKERLSEFLLEHFRDHAEINTSISSPSTTMESREPRAVTSPSLVADALKASEPKTAIKSPTEPPLLTPSVTFFAKPKSSLLADTPDEFSRAIAALPLHDSSDILLPTLREDTKAFKKPDQLVSPAIAVKIL